MAKSESHDRTEEWEIGIIRMISLQVHDGVVAF